MWLLLLRRSLDTPAWKGKRKHRNRFCWYTACSHRRRDNTDLGKCKEWKWTDLNKSTVIYLFIFFAIMRKSCINSPKYYLSTVTEYNMHYNVNCRFRARSINVKLSIVYRFTSHTQRIRGFNGKQEAFQHLCQPRQGGRERERVRDNQSQMTNGS